MWANEQRAATLVRAVSTPACECGHAYEAHSCAAWHAVGKEPCSCRAYRPRRSPEYRLPLSVGRTRRAVCSTLWRMESALVMWRARLAAWRERFEQSR